MNRTVHLAAETAEDWTPKPLRPRFEAPMNFEHMPELAWEYGHLFGLALVALSATPLPRGSSGGLGVAGRAVRWRAVQPGSVSPA